MKSQNPKTWTREEIIKTVDSIWDHRLASVNPEESGKWLVWRMTVSEMTGQKFLTRSKRAGLVCFMRDRKFGVLNPA